MWLKSYRKRSHVTLETWGLEIRLHGPSVSLREGIDGIWLARWDAAPPPHLLLWEARRSYLSRGFSLGGVTASTAYFLSLPRGKSWLLLLLLTEILTTLWHFYWKKWEISNLVSDGVRIKKLQMSFRLRWWTRRAVWSGPDPGAIRDQRSSGSGPDQTNEVQRLHLLHGCFSISTICPGFVATSRWTGSTRGHPSRDISGTRQAAAPLTQPQSM